MEKDFSRTLEAQQIRNKEPLILLVDDEPYNLDLLEQELEGRGLQLRMATNGVDALESVEASPPDMIFLDLMMPVMDGFQVLERLSADERWRDIPVVIVSASNDLENIVRGIEMGAIDFLPKPFEPDYLLARLNAGLQKKRLRDLEQRYLQSLERELEIGREIQADFLPKRIPTREGWKIQAHLRAAREVAGDFYDVFEVSPGQLGLLLGDVTDKGVGSALYMALYRSLLRATMLAESLGDDVNAQECTEPEECLRRAVTLVNRYIGKFHDSAMYVTLFFGILDTNSGELCYVNAGHDPPYFLRRGKIEERVQPTGPMVGAIEQAEYGVDRIRLETGDSLVLFSDGITDARNPSGEMFGAEHFEGLLEGGEEPFSAVLESLEAHISDAGQFDDITLLIVERT
jgi:serine phosphatase RsbU (regulator of sigma subunit)